MAKVILKESTSLMFKLFGVKPEAVADAAPQVLAPADEPAATPDSQPSMRHILSNCLGLSTQHDEKLGR